VVSLVVEAESPQRRVGLPRLLPDRRLKLALTLRPPEPPPRITKFHQQRGANDNLPSPGELRPDAQP